MSDVRQRMAIFALGVITGAFITWIPSDSTQKPDADRAWVLAHCRPTGEGIYFSGRVWTELRCEGMDGTIVRNGKASEWSKP